MSVISMFSGHQRAKGVALVAALGLAVAPLAFVPAASANTAGTGLVISEVYGGGGNSGAAWLNDYIELYNPTSAAVDVSSMSVQYRSATGTGNPTGVIPLVNSVPAHGYYLVEAASGGANGTPLPTPDAVGTGVNLSATNGTVFLATQTTALTTPPTGSVVGNASIADLVGFGTSNTFEAAAAPAPSATSSIARDASATDSDSNTADFTAGDGTPGTAPGGGGTGGPPVGATIEQIQGSGAASPLAGQNVVTDGVVTAAYPTGGFNGFYLQAAGTGGDIDLSTHDTSDAVFVYAPDDVGSVQIGDHVQVTGAVSEFNGLTEVGAATGGVVVLSSPAEQVKPAVVALPRSAAQRESLEGMLVAPQGDYTVADNYSLNEYAEIGLAAGDTPLLQPTEVADPHDPAAIQAVVDDNAARAVTLDDGSSSNYLTSDKNSALPYLTQDQQIRVGAQVTFTEPVILDYRNAQWDFQPTAQLTGTGTPPATFSHTRQAAPTPTGGNLHIASFNVLNYFPTTGDDFVASGGTCSWYDDRDGTHITVNTCTGPNGEEGPRGAADDASFLRQQAKIVHAINALGADVVSLEEIENSAKFGQDRDAAVSTLVDALNADAGATTWAYVPTPSTAGDQSSEDVIRTAFIYKVATVVPVGDSEIDNAPAFDVARDPLAQAFEPVNGTNASKFLVIVNHFKSKGSGPADDQDPLQGASNKARIAEAHELVSFADQAQADFGTDKLFLSGDFNSYTEEDPLQVLYDAGYTDIGSAEAPNEHTYLFDGVVGSLDHVLANTTALAMVTGAHVWNINSVEPVALEYSRYNYNATNFYTDAPFRASDHDPLVVGLNDPADARPVGTAISATVAPASIVVGAPATLTATVSRGAAAVPDGPVRVVARGIVIATGSVHDGTATVVLPVFVKQGSVKLEVSYLGTNSYSPSSTTLTVKVVKAR